MAWRVDRAYADPQMARTAQWVCNMMNGAESTAKMIGCSPEAIVGQAALESGWGKYAIGYNVFGIKASPGWKGPVIYQRTAEQNADGSVYYVDAPFRDYASYAKSIADHFEFLRSNGRYAAAGVFDHDDTKSDEEYFEALKRAGYATDVDYVAKLIAMEKSVRFFLAGMTQDDSVAPKPAPRMLLIGLKGDDVRALQSALFGLYLYVGRLDGDFGPMTETAVKAFQRKAGLTVDGIVGNETRAALHL